MKPTTETEQSRDLTVFWLESVQHPTGRPSPTGEYSPVVFGESHRNCSIYINATWRSSTLEKCRKFSETPKQKTKNAYYHLCQWFLKKESPPYPWYTASLIWTPAQNIGIQTNSVGSGVPWSNLQTHRAWITGPEDFLTTTRRTAFFQKKHRFHSAKSKIHIFINSRYWYYVLW